jgi:propanol-preferring alcohol dehydrogenase
MARVDGSCAYCLSGRENLCPEARFTGRHRDGGYAEVVTARAEWVYPLPAGVPALAARRSCARA